MIDLRQGDCLELLKDIPDGSVDLILTDPPYGTMNGFNGINWDYTIDSDKMWYEVNRVLRTNGACLLFSQFPYTVELIQSSTHLVPFSYSMVWIKDGFANHLMSKKAPVSLYESVNAFFKKEYDKGSHPLEQYVLDICDWLGVNKKRLNTLAGVGRSRFLRPNEVEFRAPSKEVYEQITVNLGLQDFKGYLPYSQIKYIDDEYKSKIKKVFNLQDGENYKANVLYYARDKDGYHPTQKPVALLEDLIKTYSNEHDTVLDFTCGSGSTGVACVNTNRKFIGFELDPDYFKIAQDRINQAAEKGGFLMPKI